MAIWGKRKKMKSGATKASEKRAAGVAIPAIRIFGNPVEKRVPQSVLI